MSKRALYRVVLVSLLLVVPVVIFLAPTAAAGVVTLFIAVAPLWLPVLLAGLLIPLWILYVRSQYASSVPHTVLELKPGENTPRTARAMELIFYSLYHRVTISKVMAILVGQVRLPWSFEIVAHNNSVRFFMRIPTAHRAAVESRLRAEYRDIDIDEAQDYARTIPYTPLGTRLESREFKFTHPDPYPIKTYEDYEAQEKPENPLLKLLERMIEVGPNEHLAISFLIRPHQRECPSIWERAVDTLHHDAQHQIQAIIGPEGRMADLSDAKLELVEAIESALKKPAFDCGIRAVYVASQREVQADNVLLLDTLFDDFAFANRNGLEAFDARQRLGWPLSDVAAAIPGFSDWYMLHLYRRRAYFAPPYYGDPFVLNTAELATLFHLPYVTRASALARGRGKRLEPPQNLPVIA